MFVVKMYFYYFVPLLFLSIFFPPNSVAAGDVRKLNETQKKVMREYVRQVLNLDGKMIGNLSRDGVESNEMKPESAQVRNKKKNLFPKHMLELYEKYTLQNLVGEEIIRSIEPAKDFIPHFKDIIVFNLSSISSSEKIKTAYLHIHRRKLAQFAKTAFGRKKLLPPSCRVRLFQILVDPLSDAYPVKEKDTKDQEMTKLRSLDSVLITQIIRGGWHTIDISMALKEMFDSPSVTPPAIFGVRFEGPKGKSISPQHFLKEMGDNVTSSFILIHSEESDESKSLNHNDKKDGLSDKKIKLIADMLENVEKVTHIQRSDDKIGEAEGVQDNKRKTKKLKYFHMDPIRHERKYYRENKHRNKENEKNISNDVSPDTNQFGVSAGNGDIVELLNYDRVKKLNKLRRHNHKTINTLNLRYDANTKKIVEKKAGKSRHKKNESHNRKRNDLSDVNMNESNSQVEISIPKEETNEEKRLRRSAANNNDEDDDTNSYFIGNDLNSKLFVTPTKKDRELDSEDDMGDLSYDTNLKDSKTDVEVVDKPCKVQNLTVSFEEIGFDFVLAPQSFNLGVCAGSCQRNIKKPSKKVKNEDLIEEFLFQDISQYGVDNDGPSCVPDKKSSLTVLYLNSENNIILRSFKNVIIESCICR